MCVRRALIDELSRLGEISIQLASAKTALLRPHNALPPLRQSILRRDFSIASPVTVINAPRPTPPAFRKLEQALNNLEKNAAVYINTSQLRLALRGLESADPVTRIAIIGLDSRQGAGRLTRAILADPLALEPTWEKRLKEVKDGDGKDILLRYGESFKVDDRHPLVETFSITSSLLHTHNLEILIQRTTTDDGVLDFNNLLVPSLQTPSSSGGRSSPVTYPVHKVLILTDGLGTVPMIKDAQYLKSMIQRVVNGKWTSLQPSEEQNPSIVPVNIDLGEKAIEILRHSLDRSLEFEHAWFDSGMPGIASWLSEGTDGTSEALKPTLRRLIELHSTNTAQSIQAEEDSQLKESKASEVPTTTRNFMEEGISIWAENAHTELRDRLNSAFLSKSWGKTKWWKLFWRVDEISFIALNILNQAWLVDAEKEMIWISAQIQQSGLLGPPKPKSAPKIPAEDEKQGVFSSGTRPHRMIDFLDEVQPIEPDEEEPILLHPWPQSISFARSGLSRATVPPLHALAQTLVLQTVSTTFLASTLSVLVYISVSSASVYEAGAIAAAGLLFSLRRLQKNWESARDGWRRKLREVGAEELGMEEQLLRDIIKRGGEVKFDFAAEGRRRAAREALGEVRDALDEITAKVE